MRTVYIGALYHPPKPIYQVSALLDYIEKCVEELSSSDPGELIVLAGDKNQLKDEIIIERKGLHSLVKEPTFKR